MKNLRLFDNKDSHDKMYFGGNYASPWLGIVKGDSKVSYSRQVILTFTALSATTVPIYYTKESYVNGTPDKTLSVEANKNSQFVIDRPSIYRFGIVDYDTNTLKRTSTNDVFTYIKVDGCIEDGYRLFDRCTKLVTCDVSRMDTSKMASMWGMFNLDSNINELDVSNFDTSNVTTMRMMFEGCYNIPFLNVSKWNTSNCTDMSYMFMSYTENKQDLPMKFTSLDVSNWDTSNVTNMSTMFSDCKMLNLDCSKWNINKVTNHKGFNSKAPNVIAPIWIS